MLINLAEF